MLTLYDADRCPFCARVRIVLAEKGLEHETVTIDLSDRPAWLYEKNPLGKVPVLEEDAFVLPESAVIMEYLEERYPEPALLPADPAAASARAPADRAVRPRCSATPTTRSAAGRTGPETSSRAASSFVERRLAPSRPRYDLAEIAYVPWLIRAARPPRLRPRPVPGDPRAAAIDLAEPARGRAELDVVAALPR